MPIILTDPPATVTVEPSIYEIDGVSFHNMAEPVVMALDEDGQPYELVRSYAVIEYRVGDHNDTGEFVMRSVGSVTIGGQEMLAWLSAADGAGSYALLKRLLHDIMVQRGDFPDGYNVLSQQEQEALDTLGGRLLAGAQP